MALLRFRCEHCGKRLQTDRRRGDEVACPHCRNISIVPPGAVDWSPPADPATGDDHPHEEVAESHGGVLAAAANYLPSWGSSVVLHLALILVALMGTWMALRPQEPLEVETTFVRNKRHFEYTQRQQGSRTTRRPKSEEQSDYVFRPTKNPVQGFTPFDTQPIELIGTWNGSGGTPYGGIEGFADGRGPGGPDGFQNIFTWSQKATRIVFVIDRSGSMTDSITYVKNELRRFLHHLRPNQSFHVIFYSSGPALEMPTRKLIAATEGNKLAACEFIDSIVPTGETKPAEALKAAFRLQPEVIHLLTDGEFDKKNIDLVDRLNVGKKVQVNTYCFIYPDGEWLCQEIARRNGGVYKYVDEDSLGGDVASR